MKSLLTFFIAVVSLTANFSGNYKGSYEGTDITLDLTQSNNSLTGKISALGTTLFTLSGTVDGDTAKGTAKLDTDNLEFKAKLSGEKLSLEIAEVEDGKANWAKADKLEFTRQGGSTATQTEKPKSKIAQAIGKADPESAAQHSKDSVGTLKDGKLYEHATGGKFRYPANWKLTEHQEFLQLSPPDAASGEEYFISAEPAQGKTSPTDKDVLAYLDAVVGELMPGAKRVGKPEDARAGNGKGAILNYEGGQRHVRIFVTILKGHGASLVCAGTKDQLDKRTPVLKEIFFTFGWGQGKVDPKLVGTWSYYSYSQVSGRETKASSILRADGTFSYSSESEAASNFSGKDGLGNQTWTGWVNSRSGSGYKGTWVADGKTLYLNFEDGSVEEFDYSFEQQGTAFVLKLIGANPNKPMEWSKTGN